MLCIGADKVDTETTHDHFKLAKALDIPIFIILTKTDLLSEDQLTHAINKVQQFAQTDMNMRAARVISEMEDIVECTKNIGRN